MELLHSRGVFFHVLLFLVSFKGISEGLNLRVRSPSFGDDHDDTRHNFLLLQGQSFEAECWPEEYEIPEEGTLANFSIQFLKAGVPYMPKPMWTEDPLSMEDPRLISGNEVVVPEVAAIVGDRYMVIRKEHTYESGLKVPKFVLSVKDVQPEDTGKLECYLMQDVHMPHHDPFDWDHQAAQEWGPAVKVLGDITKMEMFSYEFTEDYNYDILPKTTMYNGHELQVSVGDVPHVACRLFFPSFYPSVRFLIKDRHGKVIEDVTPQFHRFHDYQKQQLVNKGPLIKMEFMQDYINEYRYTDSTPHFRVNASHADKQLWCEATVATPDGKQTLKQHGHYITLKVDGVPERKYSEGDENTQDGSVHIPRDDDKPSAAKGDKADDDTVQRDDTGAAIGHNQEGEDDGTAKVESDHNTPQRSTNSNGGSRSLGGSSSALWVIGAMLCLYLTRSL